MGVRGELFSTKVSLQNRTYFFNVKENRLGDLYLNIVESKNRDEGGFERQSVILFAEDLQEFLQGFDESLRILEKAAREKRRGKTDGARKPFDDDTTPPRTSPSDRPRAVGRYGRDSSTGGRDSDRSPFDAEKRGGKSAGRPVRKGPGFSTEKPESSYRSGGRPARKDGDRNFTRGEPRERSSSTPRRGPADYTRSRSSDSFEKKGERKKGPPPGKKRIVVKKR